jgi:hypothetical protein
MDETVAFTSPILKSLEEGAQAWSFEKATSCKTCGHATGRFGCRRNFAVQGVGVIFRCIRIHT